MAPGDASRIGRRVSVRNQVDAHARLWTYTSDHVSAFVKDMERIGRGDDVAENADLGTAGPVFIVGKQMHGAITAGCRA
jgi:hypothetical protein